MDTLANFFTKIRNAYMVHKADIIVPGSQFIESVAKILVKEGYLEKVESRHEKDQHPFLVITLKYHAEVPALERIRQISKPGRRVYVAVDKIPRPVGGFGSIILSTPKGVMSAVQAKKARMGGEVLCEVLRGAQG